MAGLSDLIAEGGRPGGMRSGDAIGGGSNKELMEAARGSLSGNWGMAMLGNVLYGLLIVSFLLFLFSAAFYVGMSSSADEADFLARMAVMGSAIQLLIFILSGPFLVGYMGFFLDIGRESEVHLEALFVGFRRFWKSFGLYFLYYLFVSLWSLLLVIPGLIAGFRYAMAFFIMADDEDCGPLEAIRRSKEMMKGNKWKLFCLGWRFFGWILLANVTGGIGYLWLVPYMQTSLAKFYEDVC